MFHRAGSKMCSAMCSRHGHESMTEFQWTRRHRLRGDLLGWRNLALLLRNRDRMHAAR